MLSTHTADTVQHYRDTALEKVLVTNTSDQILTVILSYLPHKIQFLHPCTMLAIICLHYMQRQVTAVLPSTAQCAMLFVLSHLGGFLLSILSLIH